MSDPYTRRKIKECFISEVTPDEEVCIVGRIVNLSEDQIFLDDGRDQIAVLIDFSKLKDGLKVGDIVRVIGRVRTYPPTKTLYVDSEVVKKINGLDVELYEGVVKLKRVILKVMEL
ncbi:MAG: hypothetical protein J7L50_02670 [Candidatus Odinarchaeota archaeon]|nr:hypothetical protein [Candidatus Odinarchaeota archaeon]